jgi:hypothetical protein
LKENVVFKSFQERRVRIVATINYMVGVYYTNTTQWVRTSTWLPGDQGEAAEKSKGINTSLQMLQGEDINTISNVY